MRTLRRASNLPSALRTDGHLFCAGAANYDGSTATTSTLVAVDAGNTYSAIGAAFYNTCGIISTAGSVGVVKCWGNTNGNGQVGDGSTTNPSARSAHTAGCVVGVSS